MELKTIQAISLKICLLNEQERIIGNSMDKVLSEFIRIQKARDDYKFLTGLLQADINKKVKNQLNKTTEKGIKNATNN